MEIIKSFSNSEITVVTVSMLSSWIIIIMKAISGEIIWYIKKYDK